MEELEDIGEGAEGLEVSVVFAIEGHPIVDAVGIGLVGVGEELAEF